MQITFTDSEMRNLDPLEWWSKQAKILPHLADLSREYLAITATTVPSERLWSKAGLTVTDRRTRLKGEKLHKLLFVSSAANKQLPQKRYKKKEKAIVIVNNPTTVGNHSSQ